MVDLEMLNEAKKRIGRIYPRRKYTIDTVDKTDSGYFVTGKDENPSRDVEAYIDDKIYIQKNIYPKAIEYHVMLGYVAYEPIMEIKIRFEGLYLGNDRKNVSVIVIKEDDHFIRELDLNENPTNQIMSLCDKGLKFTESWGFNIKKEMPEHYKRLFTILDPLLVDSMSWLNSKEADLDTPSVLSMKQD